MMDMDCSIGKWAMEEFGGCELGDRRRTRRLVKTAAGKAGNPGVGMTLCCERTDAQLISRLFDQEELTFESVIACHKEQTARRCREHGKVYAASDTTFLDFSSHKSLDGLGALPNHKSECGLVMHSVLAISSDRTPLGLIGVNIWSRDVETYGKKGIPQHRRIEEKESNKWLLGKSQVDDLLCDSCRVILLGDRESDLFQLFSAPRSENLELLIRGQHNRRTDKDCLKLFDLMEDAPVKGEYVLKIPRRPGKPGRECVIEVRSDSATILPSYYLKANGEKPVSVNWVSAKEKEPPADIKEPIDWKLLTTLPVESYDEAKECISGYSNRWIIEEYHRVIKSGAKIEGLQFETLDRMLPAMAVCCVVGWRVLFLSRYFRENPEEDAAIASSEVERKVLSGWLKLKRHKNWRIKTVKDFVTGVAKMGGYLGRKCDGPPGTKTVWLGMSKLQSMVTGYLLASQTQMPREIKEMS